jgi:hypothetical protein
VKNEHTILLIRAASNVKLLVAFIIFCSSALLAQPAHNTPERLDVPSRVKTPQQYIKSIDDLMHERLEQERVKYGAAIEPEILRLEANYVRTDAPTGEVVLHEASFHLEPRYMSFYPEGVPKTDSMPVTRQSVMYFTGSARTPLALPLVSNLSKVLSGDEASYTVYLGILPLPKAPKSKSDSVSYYVVIERAVESNKTDDEKKFERYAKEFTTRPGEPIRLRLENTPSDNQVYIFKIDDNQTLNFYEDFARNFKEDILLNGEKLHFDLGKADISSLSSKLSIKYTLAKECAVKLDLLSVVDPAHPLTLIDSVMRPADYLAERDMKQFINGTYQYRLTAKEVGTGKVLFEETKSFEKKSPMLVDNAVNIGPGDTLEVGGKKETAQKLLQAMNVAKTVAEGKVITLNATLEKERDEKAELQKKLAANQGDIIAGLRGRVGVGIVGASTGYNLFLGVESSLPSLTLDLSFGWLYTSAPYLTYDAPSNISRIFTSPKSLGLQFGYSPISFINGAIQPVVRLGYYGIYSATTPTSQGGTHSATILAPAIGIMTTPGGMGTSFGADITFGPIFPLGLNASAQFDVLVKAYIRF